MWATTQPTGRYETKPLTRETWPDFAALVEANNGVWGGCWCIGFHPEGIGRGSTVAGNSTPSVLTSPTGPSIRYSCTSTASASAGVSTVRGRKWPTTNPKAYRKNLVELPEWRIGCVFTGNGHRRHGVARAGLAAALSAIGQAGGGTVEAYPEQLDGRGPQRGAYLHTGPEDLFEEFGFVRDRRIAKWRWVMRVTVPDRTERESSPA